jgi:EAL domain-containing protein (putative c-di-GMP-specific phosphodiesterase class I)
MYAAKQARHGLTIYRAELDRHDRDRLSLLHDLHVALGAGTLTLAYQPKVYSRTRGLHSVEALLRWTHPVRGPISPAVFVPLAEQAGLSNVISRWVLDQALRQCQTWLSAGRRIPVCINISMFDLRDDGFPDLVADRLAAHRVPASLLGVEVTESAAMADPARTRVVLERLQTLGVHVAVDDFGTGYSSLAYLVGLPVNELKIDRSFVARMGSSAQHAAIVRSTISLGHDLNLTVVAEGVEDESALDDLRGLGCDLIQGFTVCRPVPADRFLVWLDEDCALAA